MITYAGVELAAPTADARAAIEGAIDPATLHDWGMRSWPGRSLDRVSYPGRQPEFPIRLNTLHWPVGASRWAIFRGVVDDEMLAAISAVVYAGASGYQAATLHLDELPEGRAGFGLATSLYMLPPRPIWQAGEPSGLWLLTLVDDRWFWWQRSGVITVTGGSTSWSTLYAYIGSLLGISLTVEAVPAAYQFPGEDLASQYQALPTLLDAVALSVGQRIVRGLDGSVRAAYPVAERVIVAADLAADYPRAAGGIYRLATPPADDVPAQVPASVAVTFPRRSGSGQATGDLYAATTTLASLALAEAGGRPGHSGTHYAHSSLPAEGSSGAPSNLADLTALAARWSADWYRWRLGWIDAAYDGLVPWVPEGFHDLAWTHLPEQSHTRVRAAAGGGLCGGLDALPGAISTLSHTDGDNTYVATCCEPGFSAQLTGVTLIGGVYYYSWREVTYDCAGNVTVVSGGRTGTSNAYSLGGNTTLHTDTSDGAVVWMRPYGDCYAIADLGESMVVKLTDRSGTAYTWIEQQPVGGGTWEDRTEPREGTLNAFELNSRTNVPDNTIVRLYRRPGEDEWAFAYETPDSEACDGFYEGTFYVLDKDNPPTFDAETCEMTLTWLAVTVECGRIVSVEAEE